MTLALVAKAKAANGVGLKIAKATAAPTRLEMPESAWEIHSVMHGTGIRVFAPCGCHYTYLAEEDGAFDLNTCCLQNSLCHSRVGQPPGVCVHYSPVGQEIGWSLAWKYAALYVKEINGRVKPDDAYQVAANGPRESSATS